MKKLLVILLLLFPVHGAWTFSGNVESFFGYKFGMSYDDLSKENIKGEYEDDVDIFVIIKKPLVENKEFNSLMER